MRAMTRILHVLDHSLPLHSGYTFRTRAILRAQAARGWEVRGITGHRHSAQGPLVEEVDGLIFHRTPGVAAAFGVAIILLPSPGTCSGGHAVSAWAMSSNLLSHEDRCQ